MKQAICVMGPERSGNRLMTRLLIHAGCQGDGAHVQRWDTTPPTTESPIVWLRSCPHAGAWPDLSGWLQALHVTGYTVHAVVMTRDWFIQGASQLRAGHVVSVTQAEAHQQAAYLSIFAALSRREVPFVLLSYEALCQRPQAVMARLCARLGLEWPGTLPEPIVDGNARDAAEGPC
jgi:LPS sulfotransferase NodH